MENLSSDKFEKYEKFVNEIIEEYKAKGIAIKAFSKSGKLIYEKYFGYRNEDKRLPIDENTIFGIASITKSFVAISILQLLEEGKLSLQDQISKYIQYFTNKNCPYPILIEHFLTHSAGFFPIKRTTIEDCLKQFNAEDTLENELINNYEFTEKNLENICNKLNNEKEFIGRPGEYLSYCNDGFGILSEIIHKITGIQFHQYVDENILKPLNMKRTNCSYIKNSYDENSSILYSYKDEQLINDLNYKNNAFGLCGAGALKSTISDLTKYILMFLNEGKVNNKKILDKFYLKEMTKPRIFNSHNEYYCYGLTISEIENRRFIWHAGSLPGVSSCISFCPEEQIGIIVLCNTMDIPANLLNKGLFNLLIGKNEIIEKLNLKPIIWNQSFESQILGEYITVEEEGENFIIEKKENNNYYIFKRNGKEKEMIPVFENEAIIKEKYNDKFIYFLKNEENKIFAAKLGFRVYKKKFRKFI